MSLKPYSEYKESGIEWLSAVPFHWEINKIGRISEFTVGWTPPTGIQENFDGDNKWANISDLGPRTIYDTAKRISDTAVRTSRLKVSPRGSLLFGFKLSVGDVSFAGTDMYTNEAIATFFESKRVTLQYAYYAYPLFIIENAGENIYGARILNQERIRNAKIALPHVEEQRMIADFLDRETAEIDAFIADQKRLIELLEERRTATVAHAVTKGLEPNLPMKDSGIDWLGAIPADWAVRKLSWVSRCNSGTSISTAKFALTSSEDLNIPVIGGNGVTGYTNVANINTPRIIIGRVGALCGNVHLVQEPAWITDNALRLSFDEKFFDAEYLAHLLRARNLNDLADRTAQPLITGSVVTAQRLPHPPLSVQRSIASYLRQELAELDAAVSDAREAIALSQERRAALISAAVTGQMDVTQAQPRGSAGEMLGQRVRV